jgi:hypothetical protein
VGKPLQFYMDQHFPGPASLGLRRHGMDVLTAQDAGRCGLPDADQLQFATREERVMVSFDPDYVALHTSGVQHAGIAWCPATKYSIGELIQAILLLHGVLDRDMMKSHFEFL